MKTAIMIDGGFLIKRYYALFGVTHDPELISNYINYLVRFHTKGDENELYRAFYYDCPPSIKKVHNPVTKKAIDFSKSKVSEFKNSLFEYLKNQRKLCLRLGSLSESTDSQWQIQYTTLKKLISGKITIEDLSSEDVFYSATQKGVDMKLGIDIASLAYKKHVDRIVLIAGDSDFVPAAKLARREGIDFVLDPMWARVKPDLFEHIDGMRSAKKKTRKKIEQKEQSKDLNKITQKLNIDPSKLSLKK